MVRSKALLLSTDQWTTSSNKRALALWWDGEKGCFFFCWCGANPSINDSDMMEMDEQDERKVALLVESMPMLRLFPDTLYLSIQPAASFILPLVSSVFVLLRMGEWWTFTSCFPFTFTHSTWAIVYYLVLTCLGACTSSPSAAGNLTFNCCSRFGLMFLQRLGRIACVVQASDLDNVPALFLIYERLACIYLFTGDGGHGDEYKALEGCMVSFCIELQPKERVLQTSAEVVFLLPRHSAK